MVLGNSPEPSPETSRWLQKASRSKNAPRRLKQASKVPQDLQRHRNNVFSQGELAFGVKKKPVPWFCAPRSPCHSPQDGSRWTKDAEMISKHPCVNWSAIVHSINSSLMRPSMSPCMEGASLAQSINQSVYQSFDQSIIHATTSRDSLHSIRRNGHCGGIGAQRKKRVKAAAKPSGRAVIPKRLTIMANTSPTSQTTHLKR